MNKPEKLPVWDLSALYKSIDDPRINSDAKKNLADANNFAKKFHGRVAKLTVSQLLATLRQLEQINLVSTKLANFAELVLTTDSFNPKNSVLQQRMTDHFLAIRSALIFFDLELLELSESKLKALANEKLLSNYKHYLAGLIDWRQHHLSEKEEQIFNDKFATSSVAFNKLFDQHFAHRKFKFTHGKETKDLTEAEVLNLQTNTDRSIRADSAKSITQTLNEDARLLTLIFNTIVKDKAIFDRWHKFATPEHSRHLANEVDQKTVDAMSQTVVANYNIVQDFYDFKRKVMGLDRLAFYDRYAPISKSSKEYSFADAKKIILNAFNTLSPKFAAATKEFFDKNWIHAPATAGKRNGAFCSYVTPDTHPVVFVNFLGRARDVQTLAHELGHGVNGSMMRKQTLVNFDTPLILAETASVFGEMLVFDSLKDQTSDPAEKFALYVDKIQDTFATVFRQTSMYKFEQDVHGLQKEKGELTTEEINQLWTKRQVEMFGNKVDNKGSEQWWSYIPHFLHTPFYVYAYSFGELLVLSLYAQFKKDPEAFVPKYLEMMGKGSSQTPQEILKPFGINMSDRKFWQGGINIIKDLVVEAKEIYRQIPRK